jgi:acetyl esterase/lipase
MNDERLGLAGWCLLLVSAGLACACAAPVSDTGPVVRQWLDVPYATVSPAQKLDVYLPNEGTGPFPVIVSIHGGAFKFGDKRGVDLQAALAGLRRGYAVVSVNYRLSGEARFPAQIQDVKAAIRFVRANAGRHSLNPDRIAAWGGSAGGYLAALAGTSGGVPELEDLSLGNADQSSRVQAVVDWFGPVDFMAMDGQFRKSGIAGQLHGTADSFESQLLGKPIAQVPELVKMADPQTYISPDDPPFFIQHGTKDDVIPAAQSVEFAARLEKALGKDKVTVELLPGAGHGGPPFMAPANLNKVLDFLDRHLK